jgi:hypothetical protein
MRGNGPLSFPAPPVRPRIDGGEQRRPDAKEPDMQYVLLLYQDEAEWMTRSEAEMEAEMQEFLALDEELTSEGVNAGGEALQPSTTATSVRMRDGEVMVTDGPFAETREQLGGYYVIEADDLEAAIGVARRIPTVREGTIEIRPVLKFD